MAHRERKSAVVPWHWAALAAVALATGCAFDLPFGANVADIDRTSEQAAARIRLSAPQVYTRQQLINDRLTERTFIDAQLKDSATKELGNSLTRDLQVITSLAAQLSLSVDPALKLNFDRQNEQADLQQQINLTQLQTQLFTLQQQLKSLQVAVAAADAASAPSPIASAASAAVGSPPTVSSGTNTATSDAVLSVLRTRVDAVLKDLVEKQGGTPRANQASVPFIDEFEDRLGVRQRIRDARNSNDLDDAHDLEGNALYRLQFMATIAPGPNPRQFGIASLSVNAPVLDDRDYLLLYNTWLAQITHRLNPDPDRSSNLQVPMSYEALGAITGLYEVAVVKFPGFTSPLKLAVQPRHRYAFEFDRTADARGMLREVANSVIYEEACGTALSALAQRQISLAPGAKSELPQACEFATKAFPSLQALVQYTDAIINIAPSVEVAVHSLGDRSGISQRLRRAANAEFEKYRTALEDSRRLFPLLHAGLEEPAAVDKPPAKFKSAMDALIDQASKDGRVAVTPYSSDPASRTQRISTVASAANALELAIAAAVQVPAKGASVGAGLDYARNAAGRTDTIERVPQVIGFSGSIPVDQAMPASDARPEDGKVTSSVKPAGLPASAAAGTASSAASAPRRYALTSAYEFGWLFGPSVTLNPKGQKIELRQLARVVPVSATLSVPAWWPRATLTVRTAWRGNFDNGGAMIDPAPKAFDTYQLPLRFRRDQASLDALTVELMRVLTGQGFHQARIDRVRPELLAVCPTVTNARTTLRIYGADLWRNPSVYLGGTVLDNITVLADMAGISAEVDTSQLRRAELGADPRLVVWTSHGSSEYAMRVLQSDTCGAALSSSLRASIQNVAPTVISQCDRNPSFVVNGGRLAELPSAFRFGSQVAKTATAVQQGRSGTRTAANGDEDAEPSTTLAVTFETSEGALAGLDQVAFSYAAADGVLSVPIKIAKSDCDAKPAVAPKPAFMFDAALSRLMESPDTTRPLQVKLGLPAGKKPSVKLIAKGAELVAAVPKVALPKGVQAKFEGGVLTLSSSAELKKQSDPYVFELTLRGLNHRVATSLTATSSEADSKPITRDIVVDERSSAGVVASATRN